MESAKIETISVKDALTQIDSGDINPANVYLITLSTKLKDTFEGRGANYFQKLAPNSSLWTSVQGLKQTGKWDQFAFNNYYRKVFLTQLANDPIAVNLLEYLSDKINGGEKIYLVCYCGNPYMCHRTIIAEILMNMTKSNVLYS